MKNMTSSRPYLLRALYDWLVDNGATPHIVVDARHKKADLPSHLKVKDLVLNICPEAIRDLEINNKAISFSAIFDDVPYDVYLPIQSILGIYANENKVGMAFEEEDDEDFVEVECEDAKTEKKRADKKQHPFLRVVD